MKTIAYSCLHYGRDYLGYAIRSVIDAVDEYWILYSAFGSHGSQTRIPCPETREELYDIARAAAGSKLHWVDGRWDYEGQQRDSIHQYAPDADIVLVLDADEVWSDGLAQTMVEAYRVNIELHHQELPHRIRIPMVHFWRSFYRCVLHDPASPERVIHPRSTSPSFSDVNPNVGKIFHFGYAQRPEIVEYKQLTHGHKAQWRQDVDWFHDKFMANAQIDCHPVGSEYWNPEPVNPFTLGLPEWMKDHPYANLKVIGDVT